MLIAFLRPGVLNGSSDDQHLARDRQFVDTSDSAAQIRALASYGIKALFSDEASITALEKQIAAGIPIPSGSLHRGPVSSPAGGGH